MNEDLKNIETCLPESILAEVASVPTDPQFVSLVEESLDPLKQQAFQQAGSDAYNEVVASHKPYTFASSVRQMKSNLILLLRRFWRFPFGSGTLRSLSDMWAHYINRLQGSETYGIPSRLDQLTDLPSAPLLVADRKISGVPDAVDGISLVHLLGGAYNDVEELTDDNEGWTMSKAFPANLFPNLINATLRMAAITQANALNNLGASGVVRLEGLTTITSGASQYNDPMPTNATEIYADDVETSDSIFSDRAYPNLLKVSMKKVRSLNGRSFYTTGSPIPLRTLIVPELRTYDTWAFLYRYTSGGYTPDLIHLEIGSDVSCNLANWSPTNALDAIGTDLVEDPTAHPTWNNLQQFLQNFRSFIVLRLANRKTTSALTLTLSANVYNAVTGANSGWASQHTLAELGITDNDLTDLETELGITSATIYATWLDTYTGANGIHWDINKAN